MKKMIAAIVAACAVCCLPLLVPLFTGLSVFGLRLFSRPLTLEDSLCALAMAILAAGVVFAGTKVIKAGRKPACSSDGGCGCKPAGEL